MWPERVAGSRGLQGEGASSEAHGGARTARGQTNVGDGQVARVARWLATLKASVKLVPLGRRGKLLGPKNVLRRQRGSPARREQVLLLHLQCLRQINHFRIFDAADLGFDFGNRVLSDVPTGVGAARRQHGLRQPLAVANFSHDRADDVLRSGFAHGLPLTVGDNALLFLPLSEESAYGNKSPKLFPSVSQDTANPPALSTTVLQRRFRFLDSNR